MIPTADINALITAAKNARVFDVLVTLISTICDFISTFLVSMPNETIEVLFSKKQSKNC
jgi:hypothetical protein